MRLFFLGAPAQKLGALGVCNIYRLRYIVIVVLTVQFDNIEYFAKTQLAPT